MPSEIVTEGSAAAVRPGPARHVWRHFNPIVAGDGERDVLVMSRGEGSWLYDSDGRRYYDALSALYCVNVGYGRTAIGAAMARQAEELAYFPIWGTLTPPAIELGAKVIELAPDYMDQVFFTSGGSESVDSAWKLTRQYHRLRGKPGKTKVVAREGAYHGTSMGALSITGVPSLKEAFEPLVPGAVHAPKVDPFHSEQSPREHSLARAEAIAETIEREGPDTVGAIFIEPVQNSGGCLVAEPEYFERVREIADEYDVLLVSDETICSWGRIGAFFGCQAIGYEPDLITTAKGLTSGYAPMGAVLVSEKVAAPFREKGQAFTHGLTFGGHPVAAAAALANIEILESEGLCDRARSTGAHFRTALEGLADVPIFGEVRGIAMFQAIELVADRDTRAPFSDEQRQALLDFVPDAIREEGVICRAIHRGAPLIQFAPHLNARPEDLDEVVGSVRRVLERASELV